MGNMPIEEFERSLPGDVKEDYFNALERLANKSVKKSPCLFQGLYLKSKRGYMNCGLKMRLENLEFFIL